MAKTPGWEPHKVANETILVGMAEIKVVKGSAQFACLGLGSCVAVAAYDPVNDVGGMAQFMLPSAFKDRPVNRPAKFADTGLEALMAEIEKAGGDPRQVLIAYAGGARVYPYGATPDERFEIGPRNGQAVANLLAHLRANVVAADIGGTQGRALTFSTETGVIRVRTITTGDRPLCNLRVANQREAA